jgi:dihydroorotate dehydrogenase (NAD+) catalytic subunit
VFACARATELPIVGMGGVSTGRDALELVAAGARSVALGTVLFADPEAPQRIRRELEAEKARLGLESVADAVRTAHPDGALSTPSTRA